ncbi:MAG: tetratricopeptide repeat protein [Zoogloea sp.]|jgi:tetratricopeptide (TPR) repeat protein|nr:tetratricopeptide repeat protein [Zoogloea sp.]
MYRTRLLPVLTLSAGLAMPALTVRADAVISGTPPTLTSQPSRPDQDGIVRGQAALRMKHFDQAERAFGEAYELNPRSVEAMLGLAAATQAQGKTRLARDWMSSAVAIAPGQANVLQAQARLLTEQGLLPDAERSYHAAIASHPGMVQLKLDLAALYLDKLGKPGQAVDLLREVVRQHPEMAAAQLGLGMALSADGKFEEASRSLEDAVRRDPGNAVAHHALGVVSLRQGQAERALVSFDKALSLRKDFANSVLARGDALQMLGRHEQAIEAYQRAARLLPQSVVPHLQRARALERMEKFAEAEAAYREGLKVGPNDPRLANNLAYLLANRRLRLDEALSLAKQAVARDPKRATYHDTLGVVLQLRGDEAGARQAFERGLALEPGNGALRQRLAQSATPIAIKTAAVQTPAPAPTPAAAVPPVAPVAAPAAVAAKPAVAPVAKAAAPAVAPAAPADAGKLVAGRLEAWRQAWEAKDSARYLAFYGSAFVPAGNKPRAAWETDRRAKLDKKGEIKVVLGAPSFKLEGEVVRVSFEQRYQSGNYSDVVNKQLEWVKDGGDWKIRREAQL